MEDNMDQASALPAAPRQFAFDCTYPTQYEHMLRTQWLVRKFRTNESGSAFRAVGRRQGLRGFLISECEYSADAEVEFDGLPFVRQQFAVKENTTGSARVGRQEFRVDASTSCVVPANVENVMRYPAGHRELIVRIPPETLETKLTSLIGVLPRSTLRFSSGPVRGAHFDRLRRFLMLLVDEMARPETPHLVITELEDTFLMQFLAGNEHNHHHKLLETPKQATPRIIRLVEEYIVANWDKPFTIEEVAREFGMAVRTIYATFKQHRGYGPKTFLRQTRLNKARELLRKSSMDVATVAKLCGFSNAGHFAHYYRAAFGELPSSTAR
jgi:AraC-like DNA-binding protein